MKPEEEREMNKLLTVMEASNILRLRRNKIYKLIKANKIKASRISCVWRIKEEDLIKFISSGENR